jgi:hypothetical protein
MVSLAPVITGVTFVFTFHRRWISVIGSLYFCYNPARQKTLFFISVYSGLKYLSSLLDITGVRGLLRNFRNSLLTATCKNCPFARQMCFGC